MLICTKLAILTLKGQDVSKEKEYNLLFDFSLILILCLTLVLFDFSLISIFFFLYSSVYYNIFSRTYIYFFREKLKKRCFFAFFANFVQSVPKYVKNTVFFLISLRVVVVH